MKLAVCSQGKTLDSKVDPRFGRSQYFVIVDLETGETEAIENPSVALGHGAGINSAQVLSKKDVSVVCAQHVGPKAFSSLDAAGIRVYGMGLNKIVGDVVEEFKKDMLEEHSRPRVSGHQNR
ncbi:MAG TPA: dinitrogenase iron-molybdenum cofactor biosynthesis protein [Firmicutes bacterium]|nr:dinitrogenase iron-molybdenum cofactor biosynthesis protein [Bacillota bacterium]